MLRAVFTLVKPPLGVKERVGAVSKSHGSGGQGAQNALRSGREISMTAGMAC
jgi:hypothetical protein